MSELYVVPNKIWSTCLKILPFKYQKKLIFKHWHLFINNKCCLTTLISVLKILQIWQEQSVKIPNACFRNINNGFNVSDLNAKLYRYKYIHGKL